ncbi:thioesterase [candidate division KSB1 bacterium 4484_188]|nr:MAG: thioesterase [candidate division KSB1 bacterium 4484_188]
MARAVITLPEKFHFTTEIDVRITDLNYGNHLGNDSLLGLVHEGRVRFLKHLGYSEKDVDGCGIIMADSVIIYKLQAFYGDRLVIQVSANDFSKRACDLIYLISNKTTGKEIARAKTRIAFFDYQKNKTVPVPEKFKIIFT